MCVSTSTTLFYVFVVVITTVRRRSSSSSFTKLTLTVVEANNLALLADTKTKNHFCLMELGGHKCRTPSIRAKCWPTWNFKVRGIVIMHVPHVGNN